MFGVLRAIRILGIDASGTAIRSLLSRQLDRDLEAARVYVSLSRLQRQGLVSARDESERPAGRRGRPRRIYELSASGLQALDAGSRLYEYPVPQERGTINGEEIPTSTATTRIY